LRAASRYNSALQPRARRRTAILATGIAAGLMASIGYRKWASVPLSHVDVYDGFETGKLSRIWDTDRFERGAVTMQSEIVRAGRGAAKVVVRSRDKFEAGINGDADSERAELLEASKLISKENRTYEYTFSMLIPLDFPVVPTRLVIAQWKQDCFGHAQLLRRQPGSCRSLRFRRAADHASAWIAIGQLSSSKPDETCAASGPIFDFRSASTPHESGLLRAWLNGRQVVDYQGVNAYPENAATGYANPSHLLLQDGFVSRCNAAAHDHLHRRVQEDGLARWQLAASQSGRTQAGAHVPGDLVPRPPS
jgi:hypothetical protein